MSVDDLKLLDVMAHVAHIRGKSVDELFDMAMDKIRGRVNNPDYKRKHPHKIEEFEVNEAED